MNAESKLNRIWGALLVAVGLLVTQGAFAAAIVLEGQSKGDTRWIASNLQNWAELDYIPCRVHFKGAQGNAQTIRIDFPRRNGGGGGVPGIVNLSSFSISPNLNVTSGPTLSAPPTSDVWSYTVVVNVLDNNDGFIWFWARLAAGAHLNVGSSLALHGFPTSMGTLQIHKPAPGPGTPDLNIVKTGPITAKPGDTITYVLTYTNQLSGFDPATGVQVNDVLPDGVTVDINTLPAGANLVGNTIFWDVPNLPVGARGQIVFQAQIGASVPFGSSITNFSQILSAEDDLTYDDNISTWVTTMMSCSPPSILVSPSTTNVCPQQPAGFSVIANGTAPLSFQWKKDGVDIPGATTTVLNLPSVTTNDSGTYEVAVTNLCGFARDSGTLNVKISVSAAGLLSTTNCPGENASFTAVASGTGPFSYIWFKDGAVLTNASGATLDLASVAASDAGSYSVAISGACGSCVTNSAMLVVNENVIVSTAPFDLNACPGSIANFNVIASGTALSYQWFKDGLTKAGETTSTLTIPIVDPSDAGLYTVVVSGLCGNPVTNNASLVVNEKVAILNGPQSLTNCPGSGASFNVNATGTGLNFQWYKGGNALPGQTSSSLTMASVSSSDADNYSVVVSGACGSAVTSTASLTVNQNVVVTAAPLSLTNCPGSGANFSVNATGTGLNYQWYKGGNALPGQTGSTLALVNISALDADNYSVIVSGVCGNAVTNTASLAVNENVVVASAPLSLTNCPGSGASFSVNATGTGLNYQWYKGGNALPGQTGSTLALVNISALDADNYSVIVSGVCGNAVTNAASLTVNENVIVASAPLSSTNCPGSSASFSVNATGTGLNYQWFKGGNALPGQTDSSLNLANVSSFDADNYSVIVSGVCGNAVTNTASLTVNENVVVASAPQSLTNCPGTSSSFSVNATGTGLNYQWYKGGNALPGQTGSSLTLGNINSSDAGNYSVIVSGVCGNAVTNTASLTVNENVVVAGAPQSLTNCPGTSVSFSVNATGTGLNYQWYKGGNALPGQTGSSLTLGNISSSDAGNYIVIVSGVCGNAVTNTASLTVNENVVVANAPQSLTNCPGTSASFSVNATGTSLNYQWFKGGNALPGQTGSSLNLASVSSSDAGNYSVIVSGVCGNSVTNAASLAVNENVVVSNAPLSMTNCPGSSASFSVNATGTGLNYQWYRGGNALPGQTGSTLNLAGISSSDAGNYSVIVSGICGNAVTNMASLAVNENVVIAGSPLSLTNCPGSSASFSVNATGTGLNFQWYRGVNPLVGQTGSILNLANISSSDAGTYTVVVSGVCGNSVTNVISLTVNQDVVIAGSPQSLTNCPGSSASFSVNATGTGLNYQWYKGGSLLPGQTNSSLTLPSVSSSDAGSYSVVVSGVCGNAVRNTANLTVNQDVIVASAPQSLTNCPGSSASFSVNATGTGLNYQWFKGGNPLLSQTSSSLNLANISSSDAGNYSVIVSGVCGNAVTNTASLAVNENVVVASAPQSLTNCPGTSANFNVNATGTGLNYQWYKGGNPLPGQTGTSLTLTSLSSSDADDYSVIISGVCGNAVTNSASLTVNQNVVVASPPLSLTNCPGTSAGFSVNATGTGLNYQWFKGGNALPGQTRSSLALGNVSSSDAGSYSVIISGVCGNAVTNTASLTVNQNVVVASAPLSLTNCPGTSAGFSVNATGTGLTYQWFKGGNALPGQTSSSLNLANVSSLDAGSFSVIVSGVCGNAVTNSASLTVNENVVLASAPQSLTNCPGSSASFSVNATGTGLNYQWYKGSTSLAGQTSSSLNLANISSTDAGSYSVIVSGLCGNAMTNTASLTINENVFIAGAPQSLTNCPGSSVSFSVNAIGTGLNYQWYKSGNPLPGQTSSNLNLASLSSSDAGNYSVIVSGVCGNAVTNTASLTLNENVVIASSPQSVTNCAGSSASFNVNATGTRLNYQWYRGGTPLPGQTNSSFTLPSVSTSDAGSYSVVVSGVCGNAVRNTANLTVNQNLIVASAPQSLTNCPGSSAGFIVNATGTGLNYQWYKGGAPLAGQTSSSLNLANVSSSDAGNYSVIVSGVCGTAVTNTASLTINENVVVAKAPQSLTNCAGSSASFSVNATGTGLNYQWYKGGNALAGQTSSSLLLANISSSDSGNYSVIVSGVCGNAVTNAAGLTVNENLVIASSPQSLTNCAGSSASFSVNATGSGLNYQWYKGGSPLAGQTNSSLTLPGVSSSDAGSYSVVVSGVCGNAVRNTANLTVNQNLIVASSPQSLTNCAGSSASFIVNATGTGLNYQWYKGGAPLPGQTVNSLNLANVSSSDAGSYSVIVSGVCGNAVTNTASLAVNENVVVASAPQSLTNCAGSSAGFSVNATGTGLNYQWYKGGNPLPGQTSSSLNLANVSSSDAGNYIVIVSGICGNAVTNAASLTVNENLIIASSPQSLINCAGSSANFSVNATGTGLNYQWFKGGTPLPGQTNSSLTLPNVSSSDAGSYSVVVSGVCGNAVRNTANLTVNQNLIVASAPQSLTNCPGSSASFIVNATGAGLNYQWYKGGAPLPGQTSSSLSLANISSTDAGNYSVIVSGVCGNAVTNTASLAVNENVVVASAPQSLTNCPGTSAGFSIIATGTGLNYQWYKGGTPLPGQTSSNLNLANISSTDVGNYSVIVSGVCGNAVTNAASLTVNENLVISIAPQSLTNCPGTSASFSVNASGTGLNYQWYKGGNPLPGQTNSSLTLPSVSFSDGGSYSVVASGICGNAARNTANLVVNQNVVVASAPLSLTNCPGSSASFNVSATGTGLNYQWFKGGNPLPGQTSSTLNLPTISSSDAGNYSVIVSGVCGNAVTNIASLAVNENVVVASAPLSMTNCPGSSASFSVNATGTGLNYQWYKGGNALPGQTSSSLSLASVSSSDAGSYSVIVSGVCGNAVTNTASLTVNQNVIVASAPLSMTNCPGNSASFSVNAIGTGLNYQWYKGGNPLPGQTSSSLSLANISSTDAGSYSVIVSGVCGNAVTNAASLTVNQNVIVASAPLSMTNCPGSSASFNVNASGTGLNYQWYKGGTPLPGQTSSNFSLANISSTDAGSYSVIVSGVCGNAVTNTASLTVNQNVIVANAPLSMTNCPGSSANFSVNATGTGLNYQWYKGGNPLPGQTSSSLNLASVSSSDAGSYSVIVSGVCGNAVTNMASLTVNQNVVVASAPLSMTNCPGSSASFSVSATGTGLNYQWYKGGTTLPGQTSSSLSLANISSTDAGSYSVIVTGVCGNAVTNMASLTVNQNVIVANAPLSMTNCPGSSASFSVNATGTGLNYQWYRGGNPLPGQTSSSLNLPNISSTDAGSYSVIVSGVCGNAVTNTASLTVNQNVIVASAPLSMTNCPGNSASFSVNATGTGLNYQWYRGGNPLPGQTSSSLSLANVSSTDAGSYSVIVSGVCGNALTNTASLTVNQNVVVASAPLSMTNCPGNSASFSVNATGTGLNYQWYKSGNPLPGQTSSSLSLANIGSTDAGSYSVIVSGVCGNAVTNMASLTVNQNVIVANAPLSMTNCPGNSASFSVNATGTGLNYQWYKGGNPLPGRTSSSLSLANIGSADAGSYSVIVSGVCGNAVTNMASLTVNQNVVVASAPLSMTNCPGSSASFSVNATGTGLNYQWYKGGNPLPGQTSSSLSLANISSTDAGSYSVIVSGVCGNAVTNMASLTVNQNVVVATAPQSMTSCPGTSANFTVNATGTGLTYQWYKGGNPLPGRTSSSLNLANVSSSDAGSYSVIVSGVCGNAVTNAASLSVNDSLVVAAPPASLTNCPGTIATFSVAASGGGLRYQWYKAGNIIPGQTGSSLSLPAVSSSDAAIYTVLITGDCASSTNSALLTVNASTAATPLTSAMRNLGDSVVFSTTASGTGPFTYTWKKNGTVISGATTSRLALSNLAYSDAASYSVEVTGSCNTATEFASLAVNHPPVVTIVTPTNGAVFIAPANFTVLADATDSDGIVTNVDFFSATTNWLGQATNAPYLVVRTNVAAGTYTFTAMATDDMGATGVSQPATITVLPAPPLTIVSNIHLNLQTGLFDQTVRVSNPTGSSFDAIRVYISNLTNNASVWNASGTNDGVPFVESHAAIPPGGYVDFVIEYYVPSRITPNPILTAVLVTPGNDFVGTAGAQQHIDRGLMLPDRTFLLEFMTSANRSYYVQYSSDLRQWLTARPAIAGTGTRVQWIDNGEPKTESSPAVTPIRFYRVILIP